MNQAPKADFDVIIVGAGLSGIGSACHLTRECPGKTYAVLEAREDMGGTWDLFRYPGIRSDTDMESFGYDFAPWTTPESIAAGHKILDYIKKTAADYDVTKHIQFSKRVTTINWSSETALWTLSIDDIKAGKPVEMTCRFLSMCPGYYRYDKGHRPEFKGEADFKGDVIHPQFWPDDLNYAGKKIVLIGSGATAITLMPQLAETAAHVTMMQRTPTYIASRPSKDKIAVLLRAILPENLAYRLVRAKNIWYLRLIYDMAVKNPIRVRKHLRKLIVKDLGRDYPVDTHFNPPYNPWDQRLCAVPDGDFFEAIKSGKASMVTDSVAKFTGAGVLTGSGQALAADIIITATGIEVVAFGDVSVIVDGNRVRPADTFGYKGIMFSGLPNMVSVFGYTNAAWTLRADLISKFMCRLINWLDEHGYDYAVPNPPDDMTPAPWTDFQAGYITRVIDDLPKQGDCPPWTNIQNYKRDKKLIGKAPIDDGHMRFGLAAPS